jgi:hypothetical protein
LAVSTIRYNPSLSVEAVREAFRAHFEGKYKIEDWKGPLIGSSRDFLLVKNPFIGVSVKLEQGQNETKLVYTGIIPRIWARILFGGLLSLLFQNGPMSDVRNFIENAPEFK